MNSSPISSLNSSAWIAMPPRRDLARKAAPGAELVEAPGHAGEIGEHRIAHRGGHLVVGQGIQSDVDDAVQIDDRGPVEHGPPIVGIIKIRRQQRRSAPGGEFFQEGEEGGHQLVEVALLVVERRGERVGDRVVEVLAPRIFDQRHCARSACLQPLVEALLVDCHRFDFLAPTSGGLLAIEPVLEVVDQERLHIGGIAVDLLVVGRAAERDQCTGHDVDESPDELLERSRLALRRQLARDPRRHLGDAREASYRVVAPRKVGMSKVEHEELVFSSRALRLRYSPG